MHKIFMGLKNPINHDDVVSKYWVSFVDEEDFIWFEEMPLPNGVRTKILNGHIRAITGIHRYYAKFGGDEAYKLLCSGIYTVEKNAMKFRMPGKVNAYDLLPKYKADYGPKRTLDQQKWLYHITSDEIFLNYYEIFKNDIINQLGSIPRGDIKYFG